MSKRIVIVGGDAAGMSAAAKIKRDLPDADVIVFEMGEHISYSACGMPYWIGGVIDSDRKLMILTPDVARKRRGIDVRIHHKVLSVSPQHKSVTVQNLEQNTTAEESYDYLVIATGARATVPPFPGSDNAGVFTIRSLADGQRIFAYMEQNTVQRAVIVGGGYIGIEMAEAMRDRKVQTTIVEMTPQIMPNFDLEMTQPIIQHLQDKGVDLQTATQVKEITRCGDALHLSLVGAQEPLAADLVIVATGVRPNSELASDARLRIGESGAIWVDAEMRTSDPWIYAAGDCVEHVHLVTQSNAWIPLATSANKGGRLAGDNIVSRITGKPSARFPGILGTAVVKVFDYTMASTGLTERAAKASGLFGESGEYVGSAQIENHEKAGYWPGAEEILVKLVFDTRDGRVLGGQLAGRAGVNKRIDIIAVAITARMTLEDVAMLDLSYAPPYSPTYDPIQICANVGQRYVQPDGG